MKVPFSKTVEVEGEVDITTDDIVFALTEMMEDAESLSTELEATDRQKVFRLGQFLSAAIRCLQSVSNGMIASLSDEHAKLIADALWDQAKRYARNSK